MADLLEHLKKLAESQSRSGKVEELKELLPLFSKEAEEIENEYHDIKDSYHRFIVEIEEENCHLRNKVTELTIAASFFNLLLGHVNQGILFIGIDGLTTMYNPAAEEILKIDRVDVLFRNHKKAFTKNLFGFSIEEALEKEKGPKFLHRTLFDSRKITVETSWIANDEPLDDADPSPLNDFAKGLVIMIRDITEFQRLEMLSRQNDRMKELGEMLSVVAHEMRNPLGGIKGFAALLNENLKNQPDHQRTTQMILKGIESLNEILNRTVDYSRAVDVIKEPVDIVKLLQDVVASTKVSEDTSSKIQFIEQYPKKKVKIPVEKTLIQSSIYNLITNALHAMGEDGVLTIRIEDKRNEVLISVTDTGKGIPEKDIDKIFQPFFTTKPKGKGTGFGLAEVARIIKAHQGNIKVQSKESLGTTFIMTLPKNGEK